ncbi:uncharacterized protein [Gossypium hirsutum]|uniref:Uncharacterized protein n=1 Tax=Gossypium hirsutum TaxID=3635 RepID=A0A1U8N8B5_GOSHI|nr:uncharacterized protein LOC107945738 [Gossypium hirsutum]
MDHIGGLPMYVATLGLYGMRPPTIAVPTCIKEDVEKLFELHRKMDQSELKHNLIDLDRLWDVESDNDGQQEGCVLRVYVNVAFSKKTVWKGVVNFYGRKGILPSQQRKRQTLSLWLKA